MMKYGAVNRHGKYYSRKKGSKRKSTVKPLDNAKQPSPMLMFNASSKPIWRYVQWSFRSANQSDTILFKL